MVKPELVATRGNRPLSPFILEDPKKLSMLGAFYAKIYPQKTIIYNEKRFQGERIIRALGIGATEEIRAPHHIPTVLLSLFERVGRIRQGYYAMQHVTYEPLEYGIINGFGVDFDVELPPKVKEYKKTIDKFTNKKSTNKKLEIATEKYRKAILKGLYEEAVNEALDFSEKLRDEYGASPLVFFSGARGAHVHTPIHDIFATNGVNNHLREFILGIGPYKTLDENTIVNISNRLDRIPFTRHQQTKLFAVPITGKEKENTLINDFEYGDCIKKVEKYEPVLSKKILQKLIEAPDHGTKQTTRKNKTKETYNTTNTPKGTGGLIKEFMKTVGEPAYIPKHGKYAMYYCKLHNDTNPSLRVTPTYWNCFACKARGKSVTDFLLQYFERKKAEKQQDP